ncbi:MAG: hypothetical protein Q8O67_12620 [Deltaproteobacteria bacterium]|nr:hypothetical protein [Deltaproteobacteria bacterium]
MLALRSLALLSTLAVLGCEVVTPSNPFDPAAPPETQEPGAILGVVQLVDPLPAAQREVQLGAVRVGLLDENGRAVKDADLNALSQTLASVDGAAGTGTFTFTNLVPGTYTPLVDGIPRPPYTDAATRPVRLLPGETVDVGTLLFTDAPDDGGGPGSITGSVLLAGGGTGQRTVSLFTLTASGVALVQQTVADDDDGAFVFAELNLGTYALVAESPERAPTYRLDIAIGGETLAQAFDGAAALSLQPAARVVRPVPSASVRLDDDGTFYVSGDALDLDVLVGVDRASLGISGLRLSLTRDFVGAPVTALPESTAPFTLPAIEGPIAIFAQLEARSASGFVFTSPVFETGIVRDVTPPRIDRATLEDVAVDDDGTFLLASRAFSVTVEAIDDISAINGVATVVDAAVPANLAIPVAASPAGLVRFRLPQTVNVDGATSVHVVVQDKAGNRSDVDGLLTLPILVDTTAPDVDLVIANASSGVVSSRVLRVAFDEAGAANDLPVAMQLRLAGGVFGDLEPWGDSAILVDERFGDTDTVTVEARLFDQVGNSADTSSTATLALRGSVVGTVDPDGVPLITLSPVGATASVFLGESTLVGSDVVDVDGAFVIAGIPEGAGYRLEVALEGYRSAAVSDVVIPTPAEGAPAVRNVGAVFLPLARGDVDVVVNGDGGVAAPGVSVSLALQGGDRRFFAAASTDVAGSAVFSGVPVTRAGESYRVEAVRADDGVSAVGTASVGLNARSSVVLSLVDGGDLDVCASVGPCEARGFFNETAVRVRLRGTPVGVDALLVSINGGPATSVPLAVDNLTDIELGAVVDGPVSLSVQPTAQGVAVGAALLASVVVDRVAPTDAAVQLVPASEALDPRFTRRSVVDVVATADFGVGAPAARPRLIVAAVAPALAPAESAGCVHGVACALSLLPDEGRQNVHAFACDRAGNCADPVSAFVIRDVTAPRTGNGVGVDVIAAGSVAAGGVTVLPTARYKLGLRVGSARDGADAAVVDEVGTPLADVFAYRMATDVAGLVLTEVRAFNPAPVPGQVRSGLDVVVPALEDIDDEQRVFVELADAAGNVIAVPLETVLRVDDDRPAFTVDVVAFAGALAVPFSIATPVGAEPPVRLEVRVDQGAAVSFVVPLVNANLTLPDVDGAHQVEVSGFDAVGNVLVVSKSVLLDRAPPAITSARCVSSECVDDGVSLIRTRSPVATLQVIASDATSVVNRIETRVNAGAVQSSAPGAPIVVTIPTNATATLELTAVDAAGNRSAPLVRSIAHDDVVPAVTLSFPALADPARTRVTNVNVHLEVPAGDAVGVRFGSSLAFAGPVATFRVDDSVVLGGADGDQQVCVEVRDAAGNLATSCKSLLLDRVAPSGTIAVNNGAETTPFAEVTATLTFDVDVTQIAVSATPIACDGASFVAATTSVALTLPFFGPNTVVACLKDGAGNVTAISDGIEREEVDQSELLIAIDAGSATTRSRTVTVSLVRPSTNFTQMKLVEGGVIDCVSLTGYEAFNGTKVLPPLSAGTAPAEGNRLVAACIRDPLNADTQTAQDSIFVDSFAPNGTVLINAAATVTNSPLVSVGLTNAFASEGEAITVALSETSTLVGGECNGGFEAFTNARSFTLPGGDGLRSVFACLRDGAGNTRELSAAIALDRTAPTGSIVLSGGAITRDPAQTATLTTDNATEMKLLTIDNDVDVEAFVPFASSRAVIVEDAAVDGTKTVFLVLRDLAGNESTVSTSIVLDRVAPSSPGVVINSGGAVTNSTSVTLTLSAVGAAEMQIGADGVADDEPFVPFAGAALAILPPGDCAAGALCKTVQAIFRDAAGNVSTTASDTIGLDTAPPAGTSVTLASTVGTDAAGFATTSSVNATLAYPADAVRRKVGEGAVDCGSGGYTDLDGTSPDVVPVTFRAGDGQKTVVVCFQDAAGSATSTTASITVDSARPFATIDILEGVVTTSTSVNIRVSPATDDVDRVAFVNAASAPACDGALTFTPVLQPSVGHVLAAGDGDKTVFACFKDVAGNFSLAAVSDGIRLDLGNPTLSFVVERRGGGSPVASFTNTTAVSLGIGALASDAVAIAIANSSIDCGTAAYDPLPQPLPALPFARDFTLQAGDAVNKVVAVCVKDAAGRTNGTSGTTGTITLDTVPPAVTLSINNGAAVVRSESVTLNLTVTSSPSSEPLRLVSSRVPAENCNNVAYAGAFGPLPASAPFSLVNDDGLDDSGTKFAVGCFQDQAGNIGSASDDVFFDEELPTITGEACVGCTTVGAVDFTNSADLVTFEIDSSAVDAVSVLSMVSEDTSAPLGENRACDDDGDCRSAVGEVCRPFPVVSNSGAAPTLADRCVEVTPAGAALVSLASAAAPIAAAPATPVEGTQRIAFALVDNAGNTGNPVAVSVLRDITAPSISFSLDVGAFSNVTDVRATDVVISNAEPLTASLQLGTVEVSELANFADALPLPFLRTGAAAPFTTAAQFALTLSAGEGSKTARLRVTDNAGNQSTATRSTSIDTTPPTTPLYADGSVTINGSQVVSFAELGVVSIDSGTAPSGLTLAPNSHVITGFARCDGFTDSASVVCVAAPSPQLRWNGTTPFVMQAGQLGEGESRLRIKTSDNAGNVSGEDFRLVRKDATRPQPPTNLLKSERSSAVSLRWTASTSSDVTGYEVIYGFDEQFDGAFAGEGASPVLVQNTQLALTSLSNNNPFVVAVRAVDGAGNRSDPTGTLEVLPNPVAPERIAVLPRAGADQVPNEIVVFGPRAVAARGDAICLYDVSTPTLPVEMSCSPTFISAAVSVSVVGRFVYIANAFDGLRVAELQAGVLGAFTDVLADGPGVGRVQHAVFLGHAALGLRGGAGTNEIVGLEQPSGAASASSALVVAAAISALQDPDVVISIGARVAAGLTFGVIADTLGGTRLRPFAMNAVGARIGVRFGDVAPATLNLPGVLGDVLVADGFVYVGTSEGLSVLTSTGTTLTLVGSATGFGCASIDVLGAHAYCADTDAARFVVLDLVDPSAPQVVGQGVADALLTSIDAEENLVFATNVDGAIEVFELWTPNRFEQGRTVGASGLFDGYLAGTSVVGQGLALTTRFDVSDPENATVANSTASGTPGSLRSQLAPFGALAVTTAVQRAFGVIDPSQDGAAGQLVQADRPFSPTECGSLCSSDIVTWGNLAIVANGVDGRVETFALAHRATLTKPFANIDDAGVGGTVLIGFADAHLLALGEPFSIATGGYTGNYTVGEVVSSTQIRTNEEDPRSPGENDAASSVASLARQRRISSIDDPAGVVRIVFAAPHELTLGAAVVVAGANVGGATYNGSYTVGVIESSLAVRLTGADPGSDDDPALSNTGTVTTAAINMSGEIDDDGPAGVVEIDFAIFNSNPFDVGDTVVITNADVGGRTFNGTYTVADTFDNNFTTVEVDPDNEVAAGAGTLNIANSLSPAFLGNVDLPNVFELSDVVDNSLLATTTDGTVRRVTISSAGLPSLAPGSLSGLGLETDGFGGVEHRGNHGYVSRSPDSGTGGGLVRFAIGPTALTQTHVMSAFPVGGLGVAGRVVVVGVGTRVGGVPGRVNGLVFFAPNAVGSFDTVGRSQALRAPWDIVVGGNTLATASELSLQTAVISR